MTAGRTNETRLSLVRRVAVGTAVALMLTACGSTPSPPAPAPSLSIPSDYAPATDAQAAAETPTVHAPRSGAVKREAKRHVKRSVKRHRR